MRTAAAWEGYKDKRVRVRGYVPIRFKNRPCGKGAREELR